MGFPATAKRLDVRWKECPSNLARALHQALHSQDSTYLNDVKLVAAADGGCFQANQMVLASASPFLKQLLLELKEEEPVLVLTGVKAQTLQDLLTFVYLGEVKLGPTRVASLLSLAQTLDIYALKELETRNQPPPPFTGLSLLASAALTTASAEDHFNDENDPHVFTPSANSIISAHHNSNAGAINLSMKNNDAEIEIEDNSRQMSILNIPDPNHFKWKRAFMHCISPPTSFSSMQCNEILQSASDQADRSPPPLAIDMTDSSISANDHHPSILPMLPATPSPSPSSLVGTPSCFGESSSPASAMLEEVKSSSSPLMTALEEPKSLSMSSTSNEGKRWKSRQPKLCIHCDRYFSNQFNLKQHILNMHTVGGDVRCDKCNKTVKNKWYLRRHQVTHHNAPLKK